MTSKKLNCCRNLLANVATLGNITVLAIKNIKLRFWQIKFWFNFWQPKFWFWQFQVNCETKFWFFNTVCGFYTTNGRASRWELWSTKSVNFPKNWIYTHSFGLTVNSHSVLLTRVFVSLQPPLSCYRRALLANPNLQNEFTTTKVTCILKSQFLST